MRQVATRLAVSRWRRARTAVTFLQRNRHIETTPAPSETTVALVAALRRLPDVQRRALVLHHLAELPVAEVARLERCPEGTIKARLSRGRAALAELLGDRFDQNEEHTHA